VHLLAPGAAYGFSGTTPGPQLCLKMVKRPEKRCGNVPWCSAVKRSGCRSLTRLARYDRAATSSFPPCMFRHLATVIGQSALSHSHTLAHCPTHMYSKSKKAKRDCKTISLPNALSVDMELTVGVHVFSFSDTKACHAMQWRERGSDSDKTVETKHTLEPSRNVGTLLYTALHFV
jgi:hypothetical protein